MSKEQQVMRECLQAKDADALLVAIKQAVDAMDELRPYSSLQWLGDIARPMLSCRNSEEMLRWVLGQLADDPESFADQAAGLYWASSLHWSGMHDPLYALQCANAYAPFYGAHKPNTDNPTEWETFIVATETMCGYTPQEEEDAD
jgi:hypothetical protein